MFALFVYEQVAGPKLKPLKEPLERPLPAFICMLALEFQVCASEPVTFVRYAVIDPESIFLDREKEEGYIVVSGLVADRAPFTVAYGVHVISFCSSKLTDSTLGIVVPSIVTINFCGIV